MVAWDFKQIEAAVGELLVDGPRRNTPRRVNLLQPTFRRPARTTPRPIQTLAPGPPLVGVLVGVAPRHQVARHGMRWQVGVILPIQAR